MTHIDQKKRIGRYMKVSIESFHQNAWGGGLLFFGVDADIRKFHYPDTNMRKGVVMQSVTAEIFMDWEILCLQY